VNIRDSSKWNADDHHAKIVFLGQALHRLAESHDEHELVTFKDPPPEPHFVTDDGEHDLH
jgi:hypothetical protein